jgi:hypothetical protein
MCSLLHTRWGETCRERLMAEVRSLRREEREPRDAVVEAARAVFKPRLVTGVGPWVGTNAGRCVCGCDDDMERLKAALDALSSPATNPDDDERSR